MNEFGQYISFTLQRLVQSWLGNLKLFLCASQSNACRIKFISPFKHSNWKCAQYHINNWVYEEHMLDAQPIKRRLASNRWYLLQYSSSHDINIDINFVWHSSLHANTRRNTTFSDFENHDYGFFLRISQHNMSVRKETKMKIIRANIGLYRKDSRFVHYRTCFNQKDEIPF